LPALWALDRWTGVPRLLILLAAALLLGLALLEIIWIPKLRWRRWAYRIGDVEVDLERGFWTVARTRIPMARIQHVDTTRSPLQRRYGLASVVLYTAAGANEIPALADPVASAVRDRIAALANTRDDV
jgi:membrane protein YdbS with pleckstrin-like domain